MWTVKKMLAAKLLLVVLSVISLGYGYEEHAKTKKYLVEDDKAKHFIVETEDESPWERDLDPPPISDINFAETPEEEDPALSPGVQNRIASGNWMGGNILTSTHLQYIYISFANSVKSKVIKCIMRH